MCMLRIFATRVQGLLLRHRSQSGAATQYTAQRAPQVVAQQRVGFILVEAEGQAARGVRKQRQRPRLVRAAKELRADDNLRYRKCRRACDNDCVCMRKRLLLLRLHLNARGRVSHQTLCKVHVALLQAQQMAQSAQSKLDKQGDGNERMRTASLVGAGVLDHKQVRVDCAAAAANNAPQRGTDVGEGRLLPTARSAGTRTRCRRAARRAVPATKIAIMCSAELVD